MNRLQLATLLSWAGEGGLQGRKRLQKVVFFLQETGCPLECQYTLHHFGPYSFDVADRCDEMVAAELIDEKAELQGRVTQYSYSLKPATREVLANREDPSLVPFRDLATRLIRADIWLLELGSTVLFFHRQNLDWDRAFEEACVFKNAAQDARNRKSLEFARQVKEGRNVPQPG